MERGGADEDAAGHGRGGGDTPEKMTGRRCT
jgi:hypothetical protein